VNHDLINDLELRGKAEADCREAAARVSPNECRVDVALAATEWDPDDMRFIFEFEANLWLAGPAFDVIIDDLGRTVGYIDESKWRACSWKPLTRARVTEIASESGYVSKAAAIIGFGKGEKGCVEARFLTDARNPASKRYVARINPVLEKLISIMPEEVEL
jgi:hypothetical protein